MSKKQFFKFLIHKTWFHVKLCLVTLVIFATLIGNFINTAVCLHLQLFVYISTLPLSARFFRIMVFFMLVLLSWSFKCHMTLATLISMRFPLMLSQLCFVKSWKLANVTKVTSGRIMHSLNVTFQFIFSCTLEFTQFTIETNLNLVHFEGMVVQRPLGIK